MSPVPAAPAARTAIAESAFRWACGLDVAARKPGNVSQASPGHGMQAGQFLASAQAAARPLCRAGARVGERIEAAVRASWQAAGCNTNLGIVLLCAPLAAAHGSWQPDDGEGAAGLRSALRRVLERLDVQDAAAAYRAIALAHPGGLGSAPEQDVAGAPTVGLREAMALAAGRDRIAWQYVHAHADVFEVALPAFRAAGRRARAAGAAHAAAQALSMQAAFLALLCACPDSHIVRKHGAAAAHIVMSEAAPWAAQAAAAVSPLAGAAFADWDDSLKARGLNPGTTADMSVAAAFAAALCGDSVLTPSAGGMNPVSTDAAARRRRQ